MVLVGSVGIGFSSALATTLILKYLGLASPHPNAAPSFLQANYAVAVHLLSAYTAFLVMMRGEDGVLRRVSCALGLESLRCPTTTTTNASPCTVQAAEAASTSGILSIFVSGVTHAHYASWNISAEAGEMTLGFFEALSFLSETFVFA